MGGTQSLQTNEDIENNVFQAIKGSVLRGSNKTSPLQDLLTSTLYHSFPDPRHKYSGLYVVKNGTEMENFGLMPSFYPGDNKFIVRPLQKEFIDNTSHFRKADDTISDGITAVYSILSTLIAITGLSLASHTKSYKDIVDELTKESKDIATTKSSEQANDSNVMSSLILYSSQKYTSDTNTKDRNILFNLENYALIISKMMDKIKKKYSTKKTSTTSTSKGDILLHVNLLHSADSFAVCSFNPRTRTSSMKDLLGLMSNKSTGNLDAIVAKISQIMSKNVVHKWLDTHPAEKKRFINVLAGTARSAKLLSYDQTNFSSVIFDILEKMRDHIEESCKKNESLSSYVSKRNVLIKSSGADKYEYSKESNQMVRRIYQNLESNVKQMQSGILSEFLSIFELSKTELPQTVSIKTTDGYLCVKPSVLSQKDPGVVIMNSLINMTAVYSKFIVGLYNTIKSTINDSTRII